MRSQQPLRSEAALEEQLDAYLESARANALPGWKQHLKRWSVYAAAGCSTLAFATAAEAGIIYSGIQNVTVKTNGSRTVTRSDRFTPKMRTRTATFHMNVGGTKKNSRFTLALNWSAFLGSGYLKVKTQARLQASRGKTVQVLDRTVGSTQLLAILGQPIGASTWLRGGPVRELNQFITAKTKISASKGLWPKSRTDFAAVRFKAGVTTTSMGSIKLLYYYGWVRLKWEDPNNTGQATVLTAVDWAYNNVPDQPITPGQMPPPPAEAVPEPSSIALALLAAGAAGLAAWRRRGQAAPTEQQREETAGVP